MLRWAIWGFVASSAETDTKFRSANGAIVEFSGQRESPAKINLYKIYQFLQLRISLLAASPPQHPHPGPDSFRLHRELRVAGHQLTPQLHRQREIDAVLERVAEVERDFRCFEKLARS